MRYLITISCVLFVLSVASCFNIVVPEPEPDVTKPPVVTQPPVVTKPPVVTQPPSTTQVIGGVTYLRAQLGYYDDGALAWGVLASEQTVNGNSYQANTHLSFHNNGNVKGGTLAAVSTIEERMYRNGLGVEFHENGNLKNGYLHVNSTIDEREYKSGQRVLFYDNGTLQSGILASDYSSAGITFFPANSKIKFLANGTIDWTAVFEADTVMFHANGNVSEGVLNSTRRITVQGISFGPGQRLVFNDDATMDFSSIFSNIGRLHSNGNFRQGTLLSMPASRSINGRTFQAGTEITLFDDGSLSHWVVDGESLVRSFEQAQLSALEPQANETFGQSVAIDGDYMIIGAHAFNIPGGSGSAYIFKLNAENTWELQQQLVASDITETLAFGYSVAIDGEYAIIGAPGYRYDGAFVGAAYIFKRTGTSWAEEARLVETPHSSSNRFGWSVAIAGDHAIVGAYGYDAEDDDGTVTENAGTAYVFKRTGTTWTENTRLVAQDLADVNAFGASVAMDGERAIIGTFSIPEDDARNLNSAAYIFKRTDDDWAQEAKFSGSSAQDSFGYSLAIDGDRAIVGAYRSNTSTGLAKILKRTGTSWAEEAVLRAPAAAVRDEFGFSVDLEGDYAIVGATGFNGSHNGIAHIFKRSTTTWSPKGIATASDINEYEGFAYAVGLASGHALVTARSAGQGELRTAGAAYVYDLAETGISD